ncbi:TPA: sigma factor-like helix-turn-helix DNA-binding protein [Enterobacter cancerogenus]
MVDKTQRHRNHWTPWTVAEITFVEQLYGQLSAREIGEQLGRSANGVARIVQLSGLSRGVAPPWSEEEMALLRTHYTEGLEYVMSLLHRRSRKAICRQASLAGLASRSGWSREEKAFLEKYYKNLPIKEIAVRLGRSVSAVRAAVVKFDLGTWKNRSWTERELMLMQAHYSKGIDKIKALLPDRTREAIFAQAGKMGLTEPRFWQPDEDSLLRAIYPESGARGVQNMLPHRTIPAIKHRATSLGLRSFKSKKRVSRVRHDGGG